MTSGTPPLRVPPSLYLQIRDWLMANDPDGPGMHEWAQNLAPPENADDLAGEIIWIILCAGRSAQAARTLSKKVWAAIREGRPVVEAFGYRAKAAAIERAWNERAQDFAAFQKVLAAGDAEAFIEWCGSIPFIGDDTKFQLAKNCGFDLCKPDIWLCRLAGFPDKPRRPLKVRFPACQELCRVVSAETGDRIATVDSMLWLAGNKQPLEIDPAGVRFVPRVGARRSINPVAAE